MIIYFGVVIVGFLATLVLKFLGRAPEIDLLGVLGILLVWPLVLLVLLVAGILMLLKKIFGW